MQSQNRGFRWLFFCYILFICVGNYYFGIPIELVHLNTVTQYSNHISYRRAGQVFQKPGCHLKLLGARRLTLSRFHTEDAQILGATIQNVVAWRLWCIGFAHLSDAVLGKITFTVGSIWKNHKMGETEY